MPLSSGPDDPTIDATLYITDHSEIRNITVKHTGEVIVASALEMENGAPLLENVRAMSTGGTYNQVVMAKGETDLPYFTQPLLQKLEMGGPSRPRPPSASFAKAQSISWPMVRNNPR